MVSFIDENKETYGVEPMCSVLPIAPSTYYEHARRRRESERRPHREKRDEKLQAEIVPRLLKTTISCTARRRCGGSWAAKTYTERLAEAGIEASVGSTGDSYDNALFKAEVI